MAEKPIIFSRPMVRAILDGRKTQTRRAMNPQPKVYRLPTVTGAYPWQWDCDDGKWAMWCEGWPTAGMWGRASDEVKCPYAPGDLLWVRETFQPLFAEGHDHRSSNYNTGEGYAVNYPATDGVKEYEDVYRDCCTDACKPSIFMPKWAARLWLRITDIRVERVQDISEEDALAEGVYHDMPEGISPPYPPVDSFLILWDSINAKRGYGWEKNPWVWAYTFERVEKEAQP